LPWRRSPAGTGHWPGATSHAGLAPNLVRPTLSPELVYGILALFVNATLLGIGVGEEIEEHLVSLDVVLVKVVFCCWPRALFFTSPPFMVCATAV
jgi:hypothetical protein